MPAIPNTINTQVNGLLKSVALQTGSPAGLSVDTRSLDALKAKAGSDPKSAAREVARQFESLFMGEIVKSMRASTMQSGMLDNAGTQLGTEMLDKQLAGQISGRAGGLSEAILKQLERSMGMAPGPIPSTSTANNTLAPLSAKPEPTRIPQKGAAGFVEQHMDSARATEDATGIPASFMVSQAALETGWGRKEILHRDGTPSHNLFGIKAGGSWKGPVAEVATTEFIDGKRVRVMAKFRAYSSPAESFNDYAKLMSESPRYAGVVKVAQAGQQAKMSERELGQKVAVSMQRAGYATDPEYAQKLSRVIDTTLRLQRTLA